MDEQSEQLEQALSGRYVPAPHEGELRALVNLATDIGSLHVATPDELVRRRLAARLERMLERERDPWWMGLAAWFGAGPAPRPFVQRLAAGLAVLSIGGGAASGATGITPVDAASGIADFTGSVVRNLDPRDSGGNNPSETPTPSATATDEPPASPTPDGTTATATPPPGTPGPGETPRPNSTPTASGTAPGQTTPGTPTATTATPQTPGATETVTDPTTPTAGTTTPTAPTASPTEDDDDFETETPDDGSDDNGGDVDRDDRTDAGDDGDSSDDGGDDP